MSEYIKSTIKVAATIVLPSPRIFLYLSTNYLRRKKEGEAAPSLCARQSKEQKKQTKREGNTITHTDTQTKKQSINLAVAFKFFKIKNHKTKSF